MPSTRSTKAEKKLSDTQVPLSISFNEFLDLKAKVAALESEIKTKDALIERLQKELHDLTDPKKVADAKAFRRSRGY
jgi:hypothetical protein